MVEITAVAAPLSKRRFGMLQKMIFLALVLTVLLPSCSHSSDPFGIGDYAIPVTMRNRDAVNNEPIHILAPGESFDPSNRLFPGESRRLIMRVDDREEIVFRAGQGGEVFDVVVCIPEENSSGSKPAPSVIWTVPGGLSCSSWSVPEP